MSDRMFSSLDDASKLVDQVKVYRPSPITIPAGGVFSRKQGDAHAPEYWPYFSMVNKIALTITKIDRFFGNVNGILDQILKCDNFHTRNITASNVYDVIDEFIQSEDVFADWYAAVSQYQGFPLVIVQPQLQQTDKAAMDIDDGKPPLSGPIVTPSSLKIYNQMSSSPETSGEPKHEITQEALIVRFSQSMIDTFRSQRSPQVEQLMEELRKVYEEYDRGHTEWQEGCTEYLENFETQNVVRMVRNELAEFFVTKQKLKAIWQQIEAIEQEKQELLKEVKKNGQQLRDDLRNALPEEEQTLLTGLVD